MSMNSFQLEILSYSSQKTTFLRQPARVVSESMFRCCALKQLSSQHTGSVGCTSFSLNGAIHDPFPEPNLLGKLCSEDLSSC